MNHDLLQPIQKEVYSKKPIKVYYVIQRFPNFDGYTGGGAERHLERLIQASRAKYDTSFQPQLYVANRQNKHTQLEIPITADPDRTNLISELKVINAPDQILHLSDSYLLLYNPELFAEIVTFWKGPIVQRVTLISRMQELSQKYGSDFQNYIAPIATFISQSPEMSTELIKLGVAPEKISEIENGVDTDFFKPIAAEEKQKLRSKLLPTLHPDATIFISIARLTDPNKKIDVLIQKWQKTMRGQNAHLLLVGGYRQEETLPGSIVADLFESATLWKSNKYNIVFTGTLPATTVSELLQVSDAFLAPSILEGFSNVALEAMSSSLPILAREGVSGYGKLIRDKETGIFFRKDDDLADKILQLNNNPLLRTNIGSAARNHIIQHYSVEVMIEKYRRLYKDLIHFNQKM